MKSRYWLLITMLVIFSMLLVACGGDNAGNEDNNATNQENADASNDSADAPAEEAEPVTLRVLVHQNPPMVEFMEVLMNNLKPPTRMSRLICPW